ncbi:hypothetical protein HPHPH18_1131 [Helicobacter pylori Hp H-18]|nr:hypothetical protein HPHPH18_1131 [Helicobacter pylori Hp H-18]
MKNLKIKNLKIKNLKIKNLKIKKRIEKSVKRLNPPKEALF